MSYRSVFKPGLFEGQTIIVTGGGSGIGRCTAHEIAALGAHVVITGRKPDKLATVKVERIQKVIGRLADDEIISVDRALRLWLALD